jgi:hypothetical protein
MMPALAALGYDDSEANIVVDGFLAAAYSKKQ